MPSPNKTRTTLPLLFGASLRNRILVTIARDGPIKDAEIDRRLGISRGQASRVVTDLVKRGILERGPDYRATFARFCAGVELYAVLRKIGGVNRGTPPINVERVPSEAAELLGGKARTTTIALLSLLGTMHEGDLQRLGSMAPDTIRHVVQHFVSEGIARVRREPPYVLVSLDEEFLAAKELRALGEAIGQRLFNIEQLQAFQADLASVGS